MRSKSVMVMSLVFTLGIGVGAFAAKKGFDGSMLYRGKSKSEAGKNLLELAKKQAGKGSWERIGVGRVYYLSGQKAEGQAIFDAITSRKKVEGGDWMRIGKVYYEAGEWDKAKAAFDKVLQMNPEDEDWLAEIGAYYNLKGDRAKAEEYFARSFKIESNNSYNTAKAAGSYVGVVPN